MQYNDGSQLVVDTEAGIVKFTDQHGTVKR